jgi:hypothetical protein
LFINIYQNKTDWFIGYFDPNGHTFAVTGDDFGGSSVNIVSVTENGVPCILLTGTWGNASGGNYVKYRRNSSSSVSIYEGLFYTL